MTDTREVPVEAAVRSDALARLAAARWVLLIAGFLLALLAGLGRIEWFEAFLAFAALLAAALLPRLAASLKSMDGTAAAARSAANPQLTALTTALPEPALLVDRRGNTIVANAAAESTLGSIRLGQPLSLTVRVPEVIEAVRTAFADGKPRRVEFSQRVPVERNLEAFAVPVTFAQGPAAPDVLLLTFRDLTQQRRVDRMRADFVANASHELRTPLASLSGFIETLQGSAREDVAARERFLAIMAAQARRMSRLIDDLLSLSRVELNEHVRPQTLVDLGAILRHVCDTLAPLAQDRHVELKLSGADLPLSVQGERDELMRLFENLVENALKYGAAGKRVEVEAARAPAGNGAEAVVSVRDFGPGIAPQHLPRLTERFYRVDVETSRAEGGTGLGLAIVKHILARHRGRLTIDSELGRGATFTVRIPLAANAKGPSSGRAATVIEPSSNGHI